MRYNIQAKIYREMLEAAIESGVCNHFTVFQVGDKYSIWESLPGYGFLPNADPTPFDDNFQPKPAYFAMLDVLKNAASNAK